MEDREALLWLGGFLWVFGPIPEWAGLGPTGVTLMIFGILFFGQLFAMILDRFFEQNDVDKAMSTLGEKRFRVTEITLVLWLVAMYLTFWTPYQRCTRETFDYEPESGPLSYYESRQPRPVNASCESKRNRLGL